MRYHGSALPEHRSTQMGAEGTQMTHTGTLTSDLVAKGAGARYHRISSNKQDFDRQVDAIDRWLESNDLLTALIGPSGTLAQETSPKNGFSFKP